MAGEGLPKLIDLMARLRGPDGCAWDRAQDYDSVKGLLLEEAYEVVDAVGARDFDAIEEELGDLLFQVIFYSRMAGEENRFDIDDVIERIHAKLVRRHPHVFGDAIASTPDEALQSWNKVKKSERRQSGAGVSPVSAKGQDVNAQSLLDGIPRALPSTLEAHELGVRVARAGFDWQNVEDLLKKVEEEVEELRRELKGRSRVDSSRGEDGDSGRRIEEELGDLMFTVANLARFLHFDAETCLRRANQKFKRRFQALEHEVLQHGKMVRDCSAEELESSWTAVKARESQ